MRNLDSLLLNEKVNSVLAFDGEILPTYLKHIRSAVNRVFNLPDSENLLFRLFTIAEAYEHFFSERLPSSFIYHFAGQQSELRFARHFVLLNKFNIVVFSHYTEKFDVKQMVNDMNYYGCFTYKIKVGNKTTNNLEKAKELLAADPDANVDITVRFNSDAYVA